MGNVTYLPWAQPEKEEPAGASAPTLSEVFRLDDRDKHDNRANHDEHGDRANRADRADRFERQVPHSPLLDTAPVELDHPSLYEPGEYDADKVDRALLYRLGARDMSVREVEAWLADHDVPEGDIPEWVDRLLRLGYIDDQRLAEQLVHKHAERKGQGRQAITQELRKRKLDNATIATALELLSNDSEQQRANELAAQRAAKMTGLDRDTAERRLMGFLARRGYSSSVSLTAVKHALAASNMR